VTRRDIGVLGGLVALLGVIAILVATQPAPRTPAAIGPGQTQSPFATTFAHGSFGSPGASIVPTTPAGPSPAAPSDGRPSSGPMIREGILGRPISINPLTAQTQADRDLVALVFSGLVKLGPGNTVVPDLAQSWTTNRTGAIWTVRMRTDATWQDGVPVTAADVVFTVKLLQDPAYNGPGASSWSEVTVKALTAHEVRFTLQTPLAGFVYALRQPLLPEHLLKGVAVTALADSSFSSAPVGSGPYRLIQVDNEMALLQPTAAVGGPAVGSSEPSEAPVASGSPGSSPGSSSPGSSLAPSIAPSSGPSTGPRTAPSSAAPSAAAPPASGATATAPAGSTPSSGPPNLELRFYGDAISLMAAYRAGDLDRVDGLSAADAVSLAAMPGSKLVRYPRATFTTIALNLRPNVTLFQDVHVRTGLLQAIDRTKLISTVLSGLGTRADSPIPPKSWAFSLHGSKAVAYSTHEAALNLEAAGWHKTAGEWHIGRSKKQVVVELIVPSKASNPVAYATAAFISKSWRSLGVLTHVVALTPAEFVGDRLTTADFQAAVVDINVGLDPDLFPLFASRQAGHGGSNISGVQSLVLDAKLIAARKPGTEAERKAAYVDLQKFLSATQVTLPMFFRDEPVVVSSRVTGGVVRLLGDPSDRFWDVLTWRLAASR